MRSFREILDGQHDDLPESAFLLKGKIEDVVEAAKRVVARTPFTVEVLTPEGEVFNDEVEMVSTKTSVGSIGILANHQPLLAMLDPTELRLYKSDSEVVRYAQGEGYLQMTGDRALVLVDELFGVDDLDASDLRERLKRAEDEAANAEDGSEEKRLAERDKRRYEAFLKLDREQLSRLDRVTTKGRHWRPFFVPRVGAAPYGLVVESVKVSVLA